MGCMGIQKSKLRDRISIVTGCRNRSAELVRSLPSWISILGKESEIVIVDWSSETPLAQDPQLNQLMSSSVVPIRVARVEGANEWSISQALNFGFSLASGPLVLKLDTDITLAAEGLLERHPLSVGDAFFYAGDWRRARTENERHLNGCFFISLERLLASGGFNEHLSGYGWDDSDLYQRLMDSGTERRPLDHDFVMHAEHSHDSGAKELILRNMFLAKAMPWNADSWPRQFRPIQDSKSSGEVESKARRKWCGSGRWSAAPDANKPLETVLETCMHQARRTALADMRGIGWNATSKKSPSLLADLLSRRGPKIVIEPKNGLGNRLRALASAAILAETERRPLLILWKVDDQCEATFEQLFDAHNLLVFSSVRDLEAATDVRSSACAHYTPGQPLRLPPSSADEKKEGKTIETKDVAAAIRESSGNPSPPPTPAPFPPWWTYEGPLWISSACSLQWPGANWTRESTWLRSLSPTAAITSHVDRLLLELGVRDCIGLHIRMGQGVAFGFEDASGWEEKQARRLHHFRHASHFSFFSPRSSTFGFEGKANSTLRGST